MANPQKAGSDFADPNAYYYSELGTRFYDLFTCDSDKTGPVKGDVDFYLRCARDFGAPVLELATGTGRVLWPIARAGFEIVGVDISDRMLAVARSKANAEDSATQGRVRLHRMDMTSFEMTERFRLALIPFRAFQHLILPDQQRRSLECINRCLVPGGHLVIDVFDPRLDYCIPGAKSPNPDRQMKDPATGHVIARHVTSRVNDPIRQMFTEGWRIEELDAEGRIVSTTETSWSLRWGTRQEMRYLFELTGFEPVAEYSDFDGSPPAYGSEQVWVARKT